MRLLRCLCAPVMLSVAMSASQAQTSSDPLDDLLRELEDRESPNSNRPSAPAPSPTAPSGKDPIDDLLNEVESRGQGAGSAGGQSAGGAFAIRCEGEVGIKGKFLTIPFPPESFSFETVIDLGEKTHTVRSVQSGSIFTKGKTYGITGPAKEKITLKAETSSPQWKVSRLVVGLDDSLLQGEGSLALAEQSRLLKPKVLVQGTCNEVE